MLWAWEAGVRAEQLELPPGALAARCLSGPCACCACVLSVPAACTHGEEPHLHGCYTEFASRAHMQAGLASKGC